MNKEVDKVLGGVTVRLRNKANVCEAFLDDIFSKSELDNRKLSLTLDDENDAVCVSDRLRAYTKPSYPFGETPSQHWGDALVYVPKITTDKWKNFKPYFAFVLGHELEHVKVIREKLEFHMCATWLFDSNCAIFKKAGGDCKLKKKWKFPLELHCNKKGKKLATDLFGKEEFDKCLAAMMEDENETPEHKKYLVFIIGKLKGEHYTDSICESICRDILDYYNNRLKKAAHEIWKDEKSKGCKVAKQFDINEFLPLD